MRDHVCHYICHYVLLDELTCRLPLSTILTQEGFLLLGTNIEEWKIFIYSCSENLKTTDEVKVILFCEGSKMQEGGER